MSAPKCSEADFIRLYEEMGATKLARHLNIHVRQIHSRRQRIERSIGRQISAPTHQQHARTLLQTEFIDHPGRLDLNIENGVILVGSDAHFWPDVITTAFRAFVKFCKEMKPAAVVMNGDMLDGASISRHPPIGWEKRPSLIQEIEAVKDRLGEVTIAAGKARRYWPCGNHDARFSTRLAQVAPEFARVHGVSLKDHFPDWENCWMLVVNDDVVIKHRHKNGVHSTHNSTLWAGKSTVCGHLHSLKVTPFSDYNGTRFGVDTGTLAEPYGEPFANYTELSPVNWRSGFVVLTFVDGRLLWPEVVHVVGPDSVEFRGKVLSV